MFFDVLGPAAYHLKYQCNDLDPMNELFLTLIKLRLAKEDYALSLDFGICQSTVSSVIKTWILFMYYELNELNFWPERHAIDEHFPSKFKKAFPSTRVILDATEIPVQKRKNCDAQRMTFSNYKNTNTLKTMVGVTPRGVVSYVSPAYGGCTSDRQIIERSSLLNEEGFFQTGDSILADRGIMVQDLFASKNVTVNTPTSMKGKSQLDPVTVVKDRRIASKRIHVERLIGYTKSYKIFKKALSTKQINMGSYIIKVCFMISNFRKSIVNKRS